VPDVPALLEDAARDTLDALQQLIGARSQELADAHADAFSQYRRELEAAFLAYSLLPEAQPFDPDDPPPVLRRQWNALAFKQSGRDQETFESFQALLDTLRDIDTEEFQATLAEAADDGYARELWMLALGGVEEAASLLDLTPEDWEVTILDAGFDDVDWEQRLGTWVNVTQDKMRRWLTATTIGAAVWADTTDGFDGLASQFTQRVTGLLGNEIFRAFSLGALVALATAERELGIDPASVWLCRTTADGTPDPLVCPICRPLHLTVTDKRPIDDTHPGCRCIKVPVAQPFAATAPLPYESFLRQE
jgi:hypothetical protein